MSPSPAWDLLPKAPVLSLSGSPSTLSGQVEKGGGLGARVPVPRS